MGKVPLSEKNAQASGPLTDQNFKRLFDRSRFSFHNKKRKLRNF